jgi:hypothetical protein
MPFGTTNAFAPMITGGGLSVHVDAGVIFTQGTPTLVAAADIALTASSTNVVYLDMATGLLAAAVGNMTAYMFPIAIAITDNSKITSLVDARPDVFNFATSAHIVPATGQGNTPLLYVDQSTDYSIAGQRTLRVLSSHTNNIQAGNQYAIYSRGENHVAGMTGEIVGVGAYAANYLASAGGTIKGLEIVALTKGVNIGTIYGGEIQLDFDGGETVTNATVLRLTSQACGTITRCDGLWIEDDCASNPGQRTYNSFIRLSATATTAGDVPIDATGVTSWAPRGAGWTAGDVPIMKFKIGATVYALVVVAAANAVAFRTIT